jgi:hypothetical protein
MKRALEAYENKEDGQSSLQPPAKKLKCKHVKSAVDYPLASIFWFRFTVRLDKGRPKEVIQLPEIRTTGPWRYYKSGDPIEGVDWRTNGEEPAYGFLIEQDYLAHAVVCHYRMRLGDVKFGILCGCIKPADIWDALFDTDMGREFDGYDGVRSLIWDYFNPCLLSLSAILVKSSQESEVVYGMDSSACSYIEDDWQKIVPSPLIVPGVFHETFTHVFDLSTLGSEVFDK